MVNPIDPMNAERVAPLFDPQQAFSTGGQKDEKFSNLLSDMIKDVEGTNNNADIAVKRLMTGESQDLHSVMLAVHKADLSMKLALEIRNKLVEAYKEIMRMTG